MPPLILADLDDTLFQTRRKCPDVPDSALKVMSLLGDGQPSGYATQRQQQLIGWLQTGDLVPVTARSREVLSRVHLRQAPAICSNGGCILTRDGSRDEAWHDWLTQQSASGVSPAALHAQLVMGLDEIAFRHWIVGEAELDLYVVIKSNFEDNAALYALADSLAPLLPEGWRLHRNGNNLAYLPPWLNKRNAVAHYLKTVREETPDRLVLGAGDSWSDAGFLDLCDMAMMPTNSQIWAAIAADHPWID